MRLDESVARHGSGAEAAAIDGEAEGGIGEEAGLLAGECVASVSMTVAPANVLVPVRVSVPEPDLVKMPVPARSPWKEVVLLKLSVPPSTTRAPVPSVPAEEGATLPPYPRNKADS